MAQMIQRNSNTEQSLVSYDDGGMSFVKDEERESMHSYISEKRNSTFLNESQLRESLPAIDADKIDLANDSMISLSQQR